MEIILDGYTQCAGLLIQKANKYLLVQESQPSAYGMWNIPAGHIDPGENPQQAALREGEEETSLKFVLIQKQGTFRSHPFKRDTHVYRAKIKSGIMNPDPNEILDIRWFSVEEIDNITLRPGNVRELFSELIADSII